MCMSANTHGFGMHVGVPYRYGGEGDIAGLGGVCFRKRWNPEAVISVSAWLTFQGIHRSGSRRALALHSRATRMGLVCRWLPLQPCQLCLLRGCCLHVQAVPSCRGVEGRGEGQSSESAVGVVGKHEASQGARSICLLIGCEGVHGETGPWADFPWGQDTVLGPSCNPESRCSLGHADKTMQRRGDVGGH